MAFWNKKKKDVPAESPEEETPLKVSNAAEVAAGDSLYSGTAGRFNPTLYEHMGTGIESAGRQPGIPEPGTDTDDAPAHVGAELEKDVDTYADDIHKWSQEDERI